MKKTTLYTQILDEAKIDGPMMVDKKMTAEERMKLIEIINKHKENEGNNKKQVFAIGKS